MQQEEISLTRLANDIGFFMDEYKKLHNVTRADERNTLDSLKVIFAELQKSTRLQEETFNIIISYRNALDRLISILPPEKITITTTIGGGFFSRGKTVTQELGSTLRTELNKLITKHERLLKAEKKDKQQASLLAMQNSMQLQLSEQLNNLTKEIVSTNQKAEAAQQIANRAQQEAKAAQDEIANYQNQLAVVKTQVTQATPLILDLREVSPELATKLAAIFNVSLPENAINNLKSLPNTTSTAVASSLPTKYQVTDPSKLKSDKTQWQDIDRINYDKYKLSKILSPARWAAVFEFVTFQRARPVDSELASKLKTMIDTLLAAYDQPWQTTWQSLAPEFNELSKTQELIDFMIIINGLANLDDQSPKIQAYIAPQTLAGLYKDGYFLPQSNAKKTEYTEKYNQLKP